MNGQSSLPKPTQIDEHQERIEGDTNRSPLRTKYQQEHLDAATQQVLNEDADCFLHQSLSTPCIDAIVEAEGCYLHDVAGRRIMDFHGNGVHHVGFRHPRVMQAVKDQLEVLPFCTRRYTNSVAVSLAKRLREIAPGDLDKVLFAPGGTSAMGMAMKLARIATGRYKNDFDVGCLSRCVAGCNFRWRSSVVQRWARSPASWGGSYSSADFGRLPLWLRNNMQRVVR